MEKLTLMMAVGRAHREWGGYMRRLMLEAGIPDSYRHIIMHLDRNPGCSQKEIAEFAHLTPAAISQTVKEMELTGYIRRDTDSKDQRCVKLYLTAKGQDCADKVHERLKQADKVLTSAVTAEKEDEIVNTLEYICEMIRKEL